MTEMRSTSSIAWRGLCLAALWMLGCAGPVAASQVVNDVSGMNPVRVERVVAPTSLEDIVRLLREHPGPIAIGGGRYSMGGQTASDGALQLDMRAFDEVLELDVEQRWVRVQAGITWRKLLEQIDPHDLSPQIMQSYANFTVGGSLSVNVHGRYVGQGPLVLSVRSIRLVLADGSLVEASPTQNSELFHGAIGGYGGLGVIVEATLALEPNARLERLTRVMPLADYREHFAREVQADPRMVMHNGILYTDDYRRVRSVSYRRTDAPLTVPERLVPADRDYRVMRKALAISAGPAGARLREGLLDPLYYRKPQVQWRNHEASLDVAELQPISGADFSHVLQEYFVPEAQLESFVAAMAALFERMDVQPLNISIRHARADPGTLLAWAREDSFALVIYYRQGVAAADREQVARWTQALIDLAIAHGGSYYLPYQMHASQAQFLAAYPQAPAFFALKQRLDPQYRFRNRLWDRYYPPAGAAR